MTIQESACEPGDAKCHQPDRLDIRHVLIDEGGHHPIQANGLIQCIYHLADEQTRMGDEVTVNVLSPGGDTTFEDGALRVEVLAAQGIKVGDRLFTLDRSALAQLVRNTGSLTIFHIHGARAPAFVHLTRYLRARKLAYVVTLHGNYSHVFGNGAWPLRPVIYLYIALLEGAALRAARFVQALSGVEHAVIRRLAGGAMIRQVGNGAFSSMSGQVPERFRSAAPAGPPVFGFCSRFAIHHKGIDLLVDGFARYLRGGGKGRLELIGTGDLGAAIRSQLETPELAGHVTVHGQKMGSEKTAIMKRWHYFVLPSRFEGLPLAGLEAALAGLPVIVTRETGLGPVAGAGGGILIDGLTAESVEAALRLAEELSAARYAAASDCVHQWALDHADWSVIARSLRAGYLQQ
ncbi:glycosyltransferase family 4 protein (plasmid) [Skermanella rosea]|uniref:glycosyltransferase family 4 protein n=1 Tax=Skermanella rosea TaxID=1817965 RepID=UPI0019314E3D|nr:glycosyltransferase family 4 protein [Skermanella rosea]UEM07351.1 glycosyltransferase family 4 protein [Skermanella rosea]